MQRQFIKTDEQHLVSVQHIVHVDYSRIEELKLLVHTTKGATFEVSGLDAVEAAMLLNPSCMEGKRLLWAKNMWAFHNIVGHPVMQVLAWWGWYKAAFWVHDNTVPKARGEK